MKNKGRDFNETAVNPLYRPKPAGGRRDPDTQMLAVRIPKHPIQKGRRQVGYYRILGSAYDQLYSQVIAAYSNRPGPDQDGQTA